MSAKRRAVRDSRERVVWTATLSLVLNLSYAVYHGVLGMQTRSWWFSALWAYYTILGVTRFAAVLCARRTHAAPASDIEYFVMRVSGLLLFLLGCVLAGVNYMSLREDLATRYGTITMITIAAYTFWKLALAAVRMVKHRRNPSPLLAVIRRINYAEVAASILTLQRSMLVSFGAMDTKTRELMNALTGAGVCLFIFMLGIQMITEKRGKKNGKIKDHKRK